MQHEMATLPRLAEADGVFFITLAKGDRASVAYTIERLIDMLDAMEPDPDLEDVADDEPTLGWCGHATQQYGTHDDREDDAGDDREVENEHGGDVQDEPHDDTDSGDDEPFMGWSETCGQGLRLNGTSNRHIEVYGTTAGDPNGCAPWGVDRGLRYKGDGYLVGNDMLRTKGLPVVRTFPGCGW